MHMNVKVKKIFLPIDYMSVVQEVPLIEQTDK